MPESTQPAAAPKDHRSGLRSTARFTRAAGYKDHLVYLALIGIGIFFPHTGIWLVVLPLVMMTSFVFWIRYYRRWRAIDDLPASRIASAAQGYTELTGTVANAPGYELLGKYTRAPCVWYHYETIEVIDSKNRKLIDSGSHSVPFILRDDTGECLVHPGKAEVICSTAEWASKGNMRYHEWSIRVGDPLYALGYFLTDATKISGDLDKKSNAVLQSWLADPKAFFTRFDANRDGKMTAAELAGARDAARSAAAQQFINSGGLNTLTAPPDGRLFYLVNTKNQDPVAATYARVSKEHLWVFFISLTFLAWNLR